MSVNAENILCDSCVHRAVCSKIEGYLSAQKEIDKMDIPFKTADGRFGQIRLRDMDFIKPVQLICKYYLRREVAK